MTYPAAKFEVATSNRLERRYIYLKIHHLISDLDLGVKVTRNVAKCPLHHMTYSASKFDVTKSKALGGEAFARKFIIRPLTLTLGSRSHKICPVLSASCDLFSYKV